MQDNKHSEAMSDPRIYDAEMEGWTEDLVFWSWMVEEYRPRRVLELACGTGRITLPLAVEGANMRSDFEILGLDISQAALQEAAGKQAASKSSAAHAITFIEGDMRSFAFEDTFDLIIIGLNSFALLHNAVDQLACLRAIRHHLAPEGRFAFDVMTPYCLWNRADLLDAPPLRLIHNHAVPSLGIARFLQRAAHQYDPVTQTYRLDYIDDIDFDDGHHDRTFHEVGLHMYYPCELSLLLDLAGFVPTQKYGTYLREPFHPRSWQYLWVAEPIDFQPEGVQ